MTHAGIHVAPITEGPLVGAMIARLWPVAGVVGENGAFISPMIGIKENDPCVRDRQPSREETAVV